MELHDGFYQIEATLKGLDPVTNLAVLAVDRPGLPAEWQETGGLAVAPMGSSNSWSLVGTPVIAMGSPMGTTNSIGYGMITASNTLSTVDRNYKLLLTDIVGSRKASGALFNLKGELIGIIAGSKTNSDTGNVINAYGISELKKSLKKCPMRTSCLTWESAAGMYPFQLIHFTIFKGAYVKGRIWIRLRCWRGSTGRYRDCRK